MHPERLKSATSAVTVAFVFAWLVSGPSTAGAVAWTNTDVITINHCGVATPYPTQITVSGMTGVIADLNVSVSGISHTKPDEIELLLEGPNGQNVILQHGGGGQAAVSNVDLTFDDSAAGTVPDPLASGTYQPSGAQWQYGVPPGPWGHTLSVFNGTDPNGVWSLDVFDYICADAGSISGGWSMDVVLSGTHARTMHLVVRAHAVRGRVAADDGYLACVSGVAVIVEVRNDGRWQELDEIVTDTSGAFRVSGRTQDTRYRATAPQATVSGTEICSAVTAKTARATSAGTTTARYVPGPG